MSTKTNNFKLGLFTLFGLGLLAIGVLAFGTWSSFEKKSLFETYVAGDVSGLSVGSAVEFRGVRVGKVTHIAFSWNEYKDSQPGCVVVVFEMRDDAFVTPLGSAWRELLQAAIDRGLRARLKAQGVTGTCIISLEYLDPAENPAMKFAWTPKRTFIPSAPGLFGELLVSLQKALRRFDHLDVTALNDLAQTDLKGVGRVLERVEKVDFASLSTNATELLQQLHGSITKLDGFIGKLDGFIDDTDGTVKKMQLEKLSKDADVLVEQLQDTISKLEPGLTSVDFDALNQTLAKAHQTIQNIDDMISELKQYPAGFIFGQPPPRLKEVEPTNK